MGRWLRVLSLGALVWLLGPAWSEGVSGVRPSLAEQRRGGPLRGLNLSQPGGPQLRVIARAPAGVQPKSVSVAPDGSVVVVCNFGRPDHESVTLHDPQTLERVGMIEFEGNAVESAFSPDGRTLYVSNFRRHVVEVIDLESQTVRAEIAVGDHPKTIALSPDGALLYVANWAGREVSIVDAQRNVELRRVRTGVHPRGMVVRPDGRLLVASFDSHYIQEFEAGGLRELRRFDSCQHPRDLVLGPVPLRLFVTCTLGAIGYYDLPTGRAFGGGEVGTNPRSMDISRDGRFMATANFGYSTDRRGSISLVDTWNGLHSTTYVPRVDRFVGLAVHPGDRLIIYATAWDTSEVIAFSL